MVAPEIRLQTQWIEMSLNSLLISCPPPPVSYSTTVTLILPFGYCEKLSHYELQCCCRGRKTFSNGRMYFQHLSPHIL